jgi:DNA-binding MarR family transcriptional regulator
MLAAGKTSISRTVEDVEAGTAYFADLLLDVGTSFFGAMWHTVTVGHLIMGNLEQIARRHGVGIGDLHVLGFLSFQGGEALRPTDLARALNLTNAAISQRVNHLGAAGYVNKTFAGKDRRSCRVGVTAQGRDLVTAALREIGEQANFGRVFGDLPAEDRARYERLIQQIHVHLNRFF